MSIRICIILLMMPFASKVVFCTLSVPCRCEFCVEMRNNRVASGCRCHTDSVTLNVLKQRKVGCKILHCSFVLKLMLLLF